ncbi:rhodanese-like domain-containing protein [Luteibaculum oceani]|uniref:Rhodanese-like domain-containing protein n=1 Tax=Luteibaculum oceani TaxID=1294296 RepID=A0A5C6VL61_9FLAO|nr:rhodanese-like domain-containing protein [Luteibaculum oceani]TXC85096.1 rhodanese-like domain-containing protein [Luteibaculum oceani]
MKKYLFFILILGLNLSACAQNEVLEPKVFIENFKTHENAVLLDVRTPEEWNQGIIEGAKMINFFSPAFEAELKKLNKEQAVYVYCKSGGRSGKTAAKLKTLGFTEVYDLSGGITAWRDQDLPTVKP